MTDEIDTSAEAVERLAKKMSSQVGDDVSVCYSHEALFKSGAATLRALADERDALRQRKRELLDRLAWVEGERISWRERAEKAESQAAGLAIAGDVLALRLRHIVGPEDIVLRWENARAALRQDGGGE